MGVDFFSFEVGEVLEEGESANKETKSTSFSSSNRCTTNLASCELVEDEEKVFIIFKLAFLRTPCCAKSTKSVNKYNLIFDDVDDVDCECRSSGWEDEVADVGVAV